MNQSPEAPGHTLGKRMSLIAWITLLFVFTVFFSQSDDTPDNTLIINQDPSGHYLTYGTINDQSVVFILDTGATDVAIPLSVADELQLQRGKAIEVMTANGTTQAYQTRIDRLSFGSITLTDVSASIVSGLDERIILLGMSALKQLELRQADNRLTIKQY